MVYEISNGIRNSLERNNDMKKVLLLTGDYYHNPPGGIDLDNPKEWIRIVADDGKAGAVQGYDIDFARPLDVISFDGHPVPQGKQQENWAINNCSCKNLGTGKINGSSDTITILNWAYKNYGYHGFWNNSNPYLNEDELEAIEEPSVSILKFLKFVYITMISTSIKLTSNGVDIRYVVYHYHAEIVFGNWMMDIL